jgi:hypothetical protein
MNGIRLVFTPYDPANWTEGDEASLHHCAWHGQTGGRHSDACSVELRAWKQAAVKASAAPRTVTRDLPLT